MNVFFITFRSVTLAQRGEQLLRKNGLQCSMQRTPRWMEEKGCGYCLRLKAAQLQQAVQLLRQERLAFNRIYGQTAEGRIEEVTV